MVGSLLDFDKHRSPLEVSCFVVSVETGVKVLPPFSSYKQQES